MMGRKKKAACSIGGKQREGSYYVDVYAITFLVVKVEEKREKEEEREKKLLYASQLAEILVSNNKLYLENLETLISD